ncbi:ThuA domain-containing protein [Stieleria marina]|uniref:ThuA domain-containing protein n=1 Tax=Stieleria marina TaxID=1930275 RepID=UPI003AF3AB3F
MQSILNFRNAAIVWSACILFATPSFAQEATPQPMPLKVLLVAGGCCHDYVTQTKLLKDGIEARINAVVTVELSEDTTTKATFDIYNSDDWADGYDVVIHDECSANVTEKPYVDRILAAHRAGTPAVNLHCAMHSYRWGNFKAPVEPDADNGGWYEMIGVQSTSHGPKVPIDVIRTDADHPITKGFGPWKTGNEELYNNLRVYAGTSALVTGKQMTPPNKRELKKNPDAKPVEKSAVIAWTSEYGPKKTKVFSTSLGHQNETVSDDRYMDFVVRGLLWSTGNLTSDGKPAKSLAK